MLIEGPEGSKRSMGGISGGGLRGTTGGRGSRSPVGPCGTGGEQSGERGRGPERARWESAVMWGALAAGEPAAAGTSEHRFSAFWLRSSVVSVLISLISDTSSMRGLYIKRIFGCGGWTRSLLPPPRASSRYCSASGPGAPLLGGSLAVKGRCEWGLAPPPGCSPAFSSSPEENPEVTRPSV